MIWFTETQINATDCLKLGLGIPRLSCCANLIYYNAFADKLFTLMLVSYRKQSLLEVFRNQLATYSINIVAGYFNYKCLKVLKIKLSNIFIDYDAVMCPDLSDKLDLQMSRY